MTDDNKSSITATFRTREAADIAIEHLVQQHGLARDQIFARPAGERNSVGDIPSGGDAFHGGGNREDAPTAGEIDVTVGAQSNQVGIVQRVLYGAGAVRVSLR
jgi:hypothetical protein